MSNFEQSMLEWRADKMSAGRETLFHKLNAEALLELMKLLTLNH